jgi:hypothetical protein
MTQSYLCCSKIRYDLTAYLITQIISRPPIIIIIIKYYRNHLFIVNSLCILTLRSQVGSLCSRPKIFRPFKMNQPSGSQLLHLLFRTTYFKVKEKLSSHSPSRSVRFRFISDEREMLRRMKSTALGKEWGMR